MDTAMQSPISTTNYAGFWLRLVAHFIDMLICSLLAAIFFVFMMTSLAIINTVFPDQESNLAKIVSGICVLFWSLTMLLSHLLYFSIFESSALMATPGKLALGIVVIDSVGKRLSFWRALGRTAAKGLSYLLFDFGFIMAAFTAKKQALHDILANCLVIRKS